jgi:hypothetical protein
MRRRTVHRAGLLWAGLVLALGALLAVVTPAQAATRLGMACQRLGSNVSVCEWQQSVTDQQGLDEVQSWGAVSASNAKIQLRVLDVETWKVDLGGTWTPLNVTNPKYAPQGTRYVAWHNYSLPCVNIFRAYRTMVRFAYLVPATKAKWVQATEWGPAIHYNHCLTVTF